MERTSSVWFDRHVEARYWWLADQLPADDTIGRNALARVNESYRHYLENGGHQHDRFAVWADIATLSQWLAQEESIHGSN